MNITATLFAQIVAFVLLIWFVNRTLWGPLTAALEKRRLKISEGLEAGEEGRARLAQASQEAQKIEAAAHLKATEIINGAEKRATDIVEQAKASAQEEANRIRQGAQAEIDSNVAQARDTLRTQLGQLVVLGAQSILQREIDPQAHQAAIKELEEQL